LARNHYNSRLASTTVGGTLSTASETTTATGAPTGATVDTVSTAVTSTLEYWEISFESKADDKKLFLRMFEPTSGVLSKKKEEQWAVIQSKILPQLSQAAMIAREDTYRRRLSVLINELKELTEMDSDNDSTDSMIWTKTKCVALCH
jgi:hypothetical protein